MPRCVSTAASHSPCGTLGGAILKVHGKRQDRLPGGGPNGRDEIVRDPVEMLIEDIPHLQAQRPSLARKLITDPRIRQPDIFVNPVCNVEPLMTMVIRNQS